ncbi:SLC13 family permease [Desulfuribacillus alkaliarsenatis]|uniref:Potassium transporter TrkA n=1 Tax=Desulfuribacillus alkaliarsenatis TaxID=766136 RepID=A0A1E5G1M7_9FIRM|nr:SLC13 family permease [Desulfuribacillus alkaliarsenatis]OEF96819.1 potassium transporter TrkA [Desulfuribacillus alkaliarsenatis]
MNLDIVIVLTVLLIMLVCLIKEVARPDIIIFFSLAFLLLVGIVTPEEALRGFSNEGMLTVALLFIVASAVHKAGLLNFWLQQLLGKGKSTGGILARLLVPVSGMSAFLNNTPIVVMLMGDIRKWCQDKGVSPSKFLLPLSYASIFGGTMTLIGTSTNLVVHGLLLDYGFAGYSMFQLTIVGLPAGILGIIYLSTIGHKLLPENKTLVQELSKESRQYLAEMVVEDDSVIVGKTIEKAGLRNLTGLFLIEIIRNNERIMPVPYYETIHSGDRLIFTGLVSTIVELENIRGLRLETGSDLSLEDLRNDNTQLIEAVVSHQSGMLNKSIKETNFRSKYDAAVVAIHRNNERIRGKLGEIVLKPGDTLLLLVGKDFKKRSANSNEFYFIMPKSKPNLADARKGKIAIATLIAMVVLASTGILSMFEAAILAVGLMIVTKCITPEDAKNSVQFSVLLVIASAFGIGIALQKSGAADFLAGYIVQASMLFGTVGLLIIIFIITAAFTEMITNNAAAVLMFPIGLSAAQQMNIEPLGVIITLTIAASASFITPIGYQTNLIVYGPGGYRFTDYIKVGLPLTLLYMVVTVFIVSMIWG